MSAGRELAMMRPIRELSCSHCSKPFTARDTRAKFCSASCRVMAYKRRKRQATQNAKSSPIDSSS